MSEEGFSKSLASKRDRLVDEKEQRRTERGVALVVRQTDAILNAIPSPLQVLNATIQLHCPKNTLSLSLALRVSQNPGVSKLRLPVGPTEFSQLRSIAAGTGPRVELNSDKDGLSIDAKRMVQGDLLAMEIEVPIKATRLVDSLVRRDAAPEYPKSRESEYWMHAQVRYPEALARRYPGGFDLRDVEFPVNVAITEQIKSIVPRSFITELEVGVRLLAARNPEEKAELGRRHVAAMRLRGHGDTMELLGSLQSLFFEESFKKYVEVVHDFKYDSCERGLNFYDSLPFPTWPRSMKVVSRAQLGVDHWTADGILLYRREEFLKRVREIMGPERPGVG